MKAFKVGDCDIYAAESAEDALDAVNKFTSAIGIDDFDIDDVKQLTGDALSDRVQKFDGEGFPIIGETITVGELLEIHIKKKGSAADWLCEFREKS